MGTASRVSHVSGPLWSMVTWTRTLCVRQLTIFASRPVGVSSFPPPRHAAAIAFQRVHLHISLRQPSVRQIPRILWPSHQHDRHYLGHRESSASALSLCVLCSSMHQPEASDHGRKASTIHGWVTKLRGTLIDDERIRKRGIREMQYARRLREWKKEKGVTDQGTSLPAFSFLPSKPPQPNNQVAIVRRHTTGGASHQTSTRSPAPSRSDSRHHRHESGSRPQLSRKAQSSPSGRLLKDAPRSSPPPSGQLVRAGTKTSKHSSAGHRSEHSSRSSHHHHRSQSTRQASMPLPNGHHDHSQSRRQGSSSRVQSPAGRPVKRYTT